MDFHRILETMTESILITDTQLDHPGPSIVYVNPAFERLTGWSREEIIGRTPRVLQGPETDMSIFETMRSKLSSGRVWHGKTVNYRKDGTEFVMSWSIAALVNDEGEAYQYLAVQTDVTEEFRMQRRLELARIAEQKRLIEIEEINKKLEQLLEEQTKTLDLFAKYVPASIVRRSLASPIMNIRSSERLNVALLFCDIRKFTTIAEKLDPGKVGQLLNVYYSKMDEIIARHGGDINQFVGDEIFASFGAPEPMEDPSIAAVLCAREMVNTLDEINKNLTGIVQSDIFVGIGIHYGPVVAGNLGSKDRISYSITGDTVNTAKRIESLTRGVPNGILVSEVIYDQARSVANMEALGEVQVKGRSQTFKVFRVLV